MKSIFNSFNYAGFLALFLLFSVSACAQDKSERPSPPKTATAKVDGAEVTIDYSSPAVNERLIWGELVPYGEVWRTGANEATTITLEKDYQIQGKTVKAGKYALFTIPGEDEWTIILNQTWDQWGAYNYEQDKDVLRFTVRPEKTKESSERLVFDISNDGTVTMKWEKAQVKFQLS